MRSSFLLSILVFLSILVRSQAPQFAVVRPDGTTYICPSWDSAYNKAVNGDNIYLPPGIFNLDLIIDKKLFIYGAGHHPDSTNATGVTQFRSAIILKNAALGLLEGIKFDYCDAYYNGFSILFGTNNNNAKVINYQIKRCFVQCIQIGTNSISLDSLAENIHLTENVITSFFDGKGSRNHMFEKNIINGGISNIKFSEIRNSVFLSSGSNFISTENTTIKNNVFVTSNQISAPNYCGNIYTNNLKLNSSSICGCTQNCINVGQGFINVASVNEIFNSYSGGSFLYSDNYYLKPTCPGINAGTDGTDVGIYGTISPTAEGWVPSNPHIYFKQVAPNTNGNGQLPVQFKVRTNN